MLGIAEMLKTQTPCKECYGTENSVCVGVCVCVLLYCVGMCIVYVLGMFVVVCDCVCVSVFLSKEVRRAENRLSFRTDAGSVNQSHTCISFLLLLFRHPLENECR